MTERASGAHWQEYSLGPQPASPAAEEIQPVAQVGMAAATESQAVWALATAARPRRETTANFMVTFSEWFGV
jgi:hypothetical protein